MDKNAKLKLRPHHLACLRLFSGKGYNGEFTENMYDILARLEANPTLHITDSADCLCEKCPNLRNLCISEEKVRALDSGWLTALGLSWGESVSALDAKEAVGKIIGDDAAFAGLCGSCNWFELCGRLRKELL